MHKSILIAAAMLTLGASLASAADLPAKAPIRSSLFSGYPYGGSGFYWGINTIGGGGRADAVGVGVNPNALMTNSIAVGGTVGYTYANPTGSVFYAVEAMFDIQNFNGNTPGLSLSGPAAFEQRIKIGTPLASMLNIFPGGLGLPTVPPFPALPNGAVATNIHPYLMAGLHEDDVSVSFGLANNKAWRIAPSIGIGMMGQLTNGVAIDTWVETIFPDKAVCTGVPTAGGCIGIGQQVKVGLAILY